MPQHQRGYRACAHQMTNSWPLLILYLTQAPVRLADSYSESLRLAIMPSKLSSLAARIKSGTLASIVSESTKESWSLGSFNLGSDARRSESGALIRLLPRCT